MLSFHMMNDSYLHATLFDGSSCLLCLMGHSVTLSYGLPLGMLLLGTCSVAHTHTTLLQEESSLPLCQQKQRLTIHNLN
jgi:hypothetical protein